MLESLYKIILILPPVLFLFYNGWRGKDKVARWQFGLLMGGTTFLSYLVASKFSALNLSGLAGVSVLLFSFWWSVWGWGRYFCAGHGDVKIWNDEREEIVVDAIVDKIFGRDLRYESEARLAGTVAMSLRAYSFYPAFLIIAWASHSFAPALIGLGVFAQGLFYFISGLIYCPYGKDFIYPAEKMVGLWFGLLIAATGWVVL